MAKIMWSSHTQFVKILTEATRRGEDLYAILAASVDHIVGCKYCQKNISQIMAALLDEEETEADVQLDAMDLSQEDIETLLTFPTFELSFLGGEAERSETVERLTEQGQIEHFSEMPSSNESETTQVPDEGILTSEKQSIFSDMQLPHDQMPSDAFHQMIEKATTLEEAGSLAEAQAIYEVARAQIQADSASTHELGAKIRELQHRIRAETLLDRVARAAQALEEEGRWQEAEQAYRRLVMDTSTQQRHEEWSRAQRRCQVEMEIAGLFDEGLGAIENGDLIGAIDRLNRVVRRRPDYVRNGTSAKKILAQVKEEWSTRISRSPQPRYLPFRLVLGSGIVFAILLILGIWFSGVLDLSSTEPVPGTATPTFVSPVATPSLPVALPTKVSSARPGLAWGNSCGDIYSASPTESMCATKDKWTNLSLRIITYNRQYQTRAQCYCLSRPPVEGSEFDKDTTRL